MRRTARTFAAGMSLLGCTARSEATEAVEGDPPSAVTSSQSAAQAGFSPTWIEGDTWVVHYRVGQPAPTTGHVWSPGLPNVIVEYDWEYRVVDVAEDGRVEVVATRQTERGTDRDHATFDRDGRLLAIKTYNLHSEFDHASGPCLPWAGDVYGGLAREWPHFPLVVGDQVLEDGLEQQVNRLEARTLEVVLRRAGFALFEDLAVEEVIPLPYQFSVRTMKQLWEPGRPWWSTLVIRDEWTERGSGRLIPRNDVEFEARVVEWRPRKVEQ